LGLDYFLGIYVDLTGITKSECCSAIQHVFRKETISRWGDLSPYTDLLYPKQAQNLQWFWKLPFPVCSQLHADDVVMCVSSALVFSRDTGRKLG